MPARMQRVQSRLSLVCNSMLERRQPQANGPLHRPGLRVRRSLPLSRNVHGFGRYADGRSVRTVCRGVQAMRWRLPWHGEV